MKRKAKIKINKKHLNKKKTDHKTDYILLEILNLKLDENGNYYSNAIKEKSKDEINLKEKDIIKLNPDKNLNHNITNINTDIEKHTNNENVFTETEKKEKVKNNENKTEKNNNWEENFKKAFIEYSDISISDNSDDENYHNPEKIEIEKNEKKEESNKIIFNEYINLTDNINNNKNYKKNLEITNDIKFDNNDNLIYNGFKFKINRRDNYYNELKKNNKLIYKCIFQRNEEKDRTQKKN